MDENLKINHSVTRLTSTKRVKAVGHRRNGRQQDTSKESFQKKPKKKSEKSKDMDSRSRLHRKTTLAKNLRKNHAEKTIVKNSSNRTIDITV